MTSSTACRNVASSLVCAELASLLLLGACSDSSDTSTVAGGTTASGGGTTSTTSSSGGTTSSSGGTTSSSGGTTSSTGGTTSSSGGTASCYTYCNDGSGTAITAEKTLGTFCDTREVPARSYACAVIGDATWMAENLDYGASLADGASDQTTGQKYCVDNDTAFCDIYGGLYQYANALTICPTGWHLSTSDEWSNLRSYVASNGSATCPIDANDNTTNCVGYDLKSSVAGTWATNPDTSRGGPGSDLFLFNGLGGGGRYYVGYTYASSTSTNGFGWAPRTAGGKGMRGLFYTASGSHQHLGDDINSLGGDTLDASYGFSVRCVQD